MMTLELSELKYPEGTVVSSTVKLPEQPRRKHPAEPLFVYLNGERCEGCRFALTGHEGLVVGKDWVRSGVVQVFEPA